MDGGNSKQVEHIIEDLLGSDFLNSKGCEYSLQITRLEGKTSCLEQKSLAKYLGLSLSDFLDYEQGVSKDYAGYQRIINKLEALYELKQGERNSGLL